MQLAALTPEVTQRVLRKRLDLPTGPVGLDVEEVPRVSTGESSHSCFPRGFYPG